jgi:nucleoside-diphosphate-sugar epimerase
VEIFHHAVRHLRYTCFLAPDSRLDLMYMPDAIEAIIALMEADAAKLQHRNAYNIAAMSVTPTDIAKQISTHLPDFVVEYQIDPIRQAIADSWPRSLDDTAARADWGWSPQYDLAAMTADMISRLRLQLEATKSNPSRNEYQSSAQERTDVLANNEAFTA